jgi:hypothetical protein
MDFSSFRPFALSLKLLEYHQKRRRFPVLASLGNAFLFTGLLG